MKTTTDKLFRLIKAMTPAEKRYFKGHYGSDTNTLTYLFDAINLQKEYDEAAVKAQMTGKAASNLKVYKFQLEQLILKALMSHQHSSSVEDKIRSGLIHFDILLEKELIEMAQKQLYRAKALCLKSNNLAYLPIILEKEAKLHYLLEEGFSAPDTRSFSEAQEPIRQLLAYQYSLARLHHLTGIYLECRLPLSRQRLNQQLSSLPPALSEPDTSPPKKLLDRIAHGLELAIIGQHQTAVEQLGPALTDFKQKKYTQQLPEIYLLGLRCIVDSKLILQDWPTISSFLQEGLNFSKKQPVLAREYFYLAAYEIQYLLHTDRNTLLLKKIIKQHQKVEEALELPPNLPQTLYFAWVSIAGMICQQYVITEEYLDKLAHTPPEAVNFAPALGQFLALILQFEKSDYQQLAQLYRKIKVQNSLSMPRQEKRLYSAFIQFIGALSKAPENAAELAQTLLEEIDLQEESPFHRAFRQLSLHKWLLAIASKKPFVNQMVP